MKLSISTLTTIAVTAAAVTLVSCKGKKEEQQNAGAQGLMPVPVASPVKKSVTLTEVYTGRFEATEKVEVRSRVSGYIDQIHFKEGQLIKQGEPMFSIDPSIFDADLANARARVTQVETAIKLADSNLRRAASLVKNNAISREEFDVRQAEHDKAKADLKSAEAQLRRAALNREFADIAAPISGIAGKHQITRGNYINGGNAGAQVLTTIIPQNPIDVYFEMNERQVLEFKRLAQDAVAKGAGRQRLAVEIAVSDSDKFEYSGVIDYTENALDPSTATMRMRARVNNDSGLLTPGLFAKVRMPVGGQRDLILVKESALGFDQDKRYAWVLQKDNTLARAYVQVGSAQGDMRVVRSGLAPSDKIAIGRIQFLRPKVPVNPMPAPMETPTQTAADTGK
ncbi:MAG: efflux RND transporter periplasmic adaptor subunit [Akkermansiaceae bacterium]|nr:efflux RND transporter periplasmic adaptor subunit [Akkermansiaceae bacterium]